MKKTTNIELTRAEVLEAIIRYLEEQDDSFSVADDTITLSMAEFVITSLTEHEINETIGAVFSAKEE